MIIYYPIYKTFVSKACFKNRLHKLYLPKYLFHVVSCLRHFKIFILVWGILFKFRIRLQKMAKQTNKCALFGLITVTIAQFRSGSFRRFIWYVFFFFFIVWRVHKLSWWFSDTGTGDIQLTKWVAWIYKLNALRHYSITAFVISPLLLRMQAAP